MSNIAILASGSGSNAENIILYFKNNPSVKIDSVWSNKKEAFVLQRAHNLGIEANYFTKSDFSDNQGLLAEFQRRKIDLVVLAGFLWLIPVSFVRNFRIVNIHPALLPQYGGKGMFGNFVHQAVIANQEKESGITIHMVDEQYDHGRILFQAKCPVTREDSPDSLAKKIHQLEFEHFPRIIEKIVLKEI